MKKIPLYEINLLHSFDCVREIIRFKNNALPKINQKIDEINDARPTPKWSLALAAISENVYTMYLVHDEDVTQQIFEQHVSNGEPTSGLVYKALDGKTYTLSDSILNQKVSRQTVRKEDIDLFMNKKLKKMETNLRKLAQQYNFYSLVDSYAPMDFSFATA